MKIKSRKYPEHCDKLLEDVTNDIKKKINDIKLPLRSKRNLTLKESDGLRWCRKMTRDRKMYITQADKGGCILIMDADNVHEIIVECLQDKTKYEKINTNPRD